MLTKRMGSHMCGHQFAVDLFTSSQDVDENITVDFRLQSSRAFCRLKCMLKPYFHALTMDLRDRSIAQRSSAVAGMGRKGAHPSHAARHLQVTMSKTSVVDMDFRYVGSGST